MKVSSKVLHPKLSYTIYGLCFQTHNDLGRYCNEKQYADYLENLFKNQKIVYAREVALPESFKGERGRRNIPDFFIENDIVLDLKAKRFVDKEDYFQMRRYLRASNKKLGIIVNFRDKRLLPKRVLNSAV